MKARPRQAENKVAEIMSDFFLRYGLSPVQRIPLLGREGPDITMNEAKLVIDVKSRMTCPSGILEAVERTGKAGVDHIAAFRLEALPEALVDNVGPYNIMKPSKMVKDWLNHMAEWTQANVTNGIPAVVIHQPQLPYGKSALVVYQSDVGLLRDRIIKPTVIGHGEAWLDLGKTKINVVTPTQEYTINLTQENLYTLEKWIRHGN